MHEDFNKKHFPFTAAILREGEKEKSIRANCTTVAGYLCKLSAKKVKGSWVNSFAPFWDKKKMPDDKKHLTEITDMKKIVGTDAEQYLIRFGKVEGEYWVWNLDASEKKKTEAKAEVRFYKKWKDPHDDDEDDYKLSGDNYPKAVLDIVKKYTYVEETRHIKHTILKDGTGLANELKTINWTLKVK